MSLIQKRVPIGILPAVLVMIDKCRNRDLIKKLVSEKATSYSLKVPEEIYNKVEEVCEKYRHIMEIAGADTDTKRSVGVLDEN